MDVLLLDKAFIGMVLSAIEVYKNECLGALLGYNLKNRIVVEYAIPYQTAKRKPTEAEPNWNREIRVHEILPNLLHLKHVGYFHSHTQWGEIKASTELSIKDVKSIIPGQIEIVVAINDAKRRIPWSSKSSGELYGTLGKYGIYMACHYKTAKSQKIKKYPLLCPYALGFDETFKA